MDMKKFNIDRPPTTIEELNKYLTKSDIYNFYHMAEVEVDRMLDRFYNRASYYSLIKHLLPGISEEDETTEKYDDALYTIYSVVANKVKQCMAIHLLGGKQECINFIAKYIDRKYKIVFVGDKILIVDNIGQFMEEKVHE